MPSHLHCSSTAGTLSHTLRNSRDSRQSSVGIPSCTRDPDTDWPRYSPRADSTGTHLLLHFHFPRRDKPYPTTRVRPAIHLERRLLPVKTLHLRSQTISVWYQGSSNLSPLQQPWTRRETNQDFDQGTIVITLYGVDFRDGGSDRDRSIRRCYRQSCNQK